MNTAVFHPHFIFPRFTHPAGTHPAGTHTAGLRSRPGLLLMLLAGMALLVAANAIALPRLPATIKPADNLLTTEGGLSGVSGLLAGRPCIAARANYIGDTVWRGNRVQLWLCYKLESVVATKQYFNPSWQRVVREEYANGESAEIGTSRWQAAVEPATVERFEID